MSTSETDNLWNFQENHSVRLDRDSCVGCTNCIKRCPTRAIRVRDGKAKIIYELCIDCGECVRTCQHHAKIPIYDPLSRMDDFEYKVALPAPSLYAQFNNLHDCNIVLTALLMMGFDMVYEVSAAAEIVSAMSRKYVDEHPEKWPLISSACPSIVKLVRTRFPSLIEHLLPIQPPVELAATLARKKAMEETGLPSESIGIFFISPCPAKVSSNRNPMGVKRTDVDATLAIKEVYVKLLPFMNKAAAAPMDLATSGKVGVGWGMGGGEGSGLILDNYMDTSGMENCLHVLNDMEDRQLPDIKFVELNACAGGCVGGVLQVESPFVARAKLGALKKHLPVAEKAALPEPEGMWTEELEHIPDDSLGTSYREKREKMAQVEELVKKFPGTDCGSCGSPSCRKLAEDIVIGRAKETDCIHILMDYINQISGMLARIDRNPENDISSADKKD